MTVFLANISNPGMIRAKWMRNIADVRKAFNDNSRIKSWQQVTEGTWLVRTEDSMTATDLREAISEALYYKASHAGKAVEEFVVSLDDDTQTSIRSRKPNDTINWLREHIGGEEREPPAPPKKNPRRFKL